MIHNTIKFNSPSLDTDQSIDSSAQCCVRVQARHVTLSVRSNLGDVLDLSLGGARILTTSIPRSPIDIEFYAVNKSITLRARVAWTQATGNTFKTEVGLVFTKMTRTQREMINSLSQGKMHRALL